MIGGASGEDCFYLFIIQSPRCCLSKQRHQECPVPGLEKDPRKFCSELQTAGQNLNGMLISRHQHQISTSSRNFKVNHHTTSNSTANFNTGINVNLKHLYVHEELE